MSPSLLWPSARSMDEFPRGAGGMIVLLTLEMKMLF